MAIGTIPFAPAAGSTESVIYSQPLRCITEGLNAAAAALTVIGAGIAVVAAQAARAAAYGAWYAADVAAAAGTAGTLGASLIAVSAAAAALAAAEAAVTATATILAGAVATAASADYALWQCLNPPGTVPGSGGGGGGGSEGSPVTSGGGGSYITGDCTFWAVLDSNDNFLYWEDPNMCLSMAA